LFELEGEGIDIEMCQTVCRWYACECCGFIIMIFENSNRCKFHTINTYISLDKTGTYISARQSVKQFRVIVDLH